MTCVSLLSTVAPRALNRPPEHQGCRFTSAFQISRGFSLVVKPHVYNKGREILENVAPAELCPHSTKPSTILLMNVQTV